MNEFELINHLTEGALRRADELLYGVGDDCAIIAGHNNQDWLVTTDVLIEGVHFKLDFCDLKTLGRKALAVNLSDIAAMGGKPRFYLVSIAIPDSIGPYGAIELYKGMRERASLHDVVLIGGDTSSSKSGLVISITAIGECAGGHAILRNKAMPCDDIYVTGKFGGAALGLAFLSAHRSDSVSLPFMKRHLDPEPRVNAGLALMKSGMVSAMIDVSDGLLADLSHIADASNVGFEIREKEVPCDHGIEELAKTLNIDPATLILSGGEDYELAFTVRANCVGDFERTVVPKLPVAVAKIGTIVADKTLKSVLDSEGKILTLKHKGFDHFG